MKEEKLFDLGEDYTLYQTGELTDEIVQFLENTAVGTKDNLYRHYGIREFVAHTPRTEFYLMRDHAKELLAMVAFCRRDFIWDPPYEGAYVRYFAASPKIRGKKLIRRFSQEFFNWVRKTQVTPAVFYGTIEGRNEASRGVAAPLGFEPITPVVISGFSRFFPEKKGDVRPVSDEEWKELLPKLDALYSEHAFWGHDYLNLHNNYFVLKKDGKIVCGAQVHTAHWVVEKAAGFLGKYVFPILPYVPIIRKVFNPKAFRFLNFEGIYCEKGYEAELANLFESVLNIKKYYSAMFWFDERDPLYQFLNRQKNMGLLSKFARGFKSTFVINYQNFPKEKAEKISAAKVFYANGYEYL